VENGAVDLLNRNILKFPWVSVFDASFDLENLTGRIGDLHGDSRVRGSRFCCWSARNRKPHVAGRGSRHGIAGGPAAVGLATAIVDCMQNLQVHSVEASGTFVLSYKIRPTQDVPATGVMSGKVGAGSARAAGYPIPRIGDAHVGIGAVRSTVAVHTSDHNGVKSGHGSPDP